MTTSPDNNPGKPVSTPTHIMSHAHKINFLLKIHFFYVVTLVVHVGMDFVGMCKYRCWPQPKASDHLELELHLVVSHHLGVENGNPVLWKAIAVLKG